MIEEILRDKICLLSSMADEKIYLNTAVKSERPPYIVINKVSAPRGDTHSGKDGTVQARFDIKIIADNYVDAKVFASELYDIKDMDTVARSILENETDLYYEDVNIHLVNLDYLIYYKEE